MRPSRRWWDFHFVRLALCVAVIATVAGSATARAQDAAPKAAPAQTESVAPQAQPAPSVTPTVRPGAPSVGPHALPRDLSPWGMFAGADIIVKLVMIGLAFASVVTWTIWLVKALELWRASRQLRVAIPHIAGAETIENAVKVLRQLEGNRGKNSDSAAALLAREAAEEMHVSLPLLDQAGSPGIKERVTSRLSRVEVMAGRKISRGVGLLATIGATAPFVGLFGTVWGIMDSFIGISQAQTTNLAVVAPGIAEALLATALGLVAAIPAVIIYNVFARGIAGYRHLLGDASAAIERLVSRELDLRRGSKGMRVRAAE